MKKLITILALFIFTISKAQVFTGVGGPVQNNGQETYFPITVTGLATNIDSIYGLEQVCFTITHPDTRELYISLRSPNGTLVNIVLGSSATGPDYTSTCLDHASGTSITLGVAPYTGNYRPVGYLGRFNTSQPGNGTWSLVVKDGFLNSNAGTVISWSLKFGPAPAHPVILTSSNLPLVFINASAPITDTKSIINMGIVWNGANRNYVTDPLNNYNGKAQICIRGNSTKNFEKKSYSFETHDVVGNELKTSILGMPTESDWVLVSNYIDKTQIRNAMTYDLARKMGRYAVRHKMVELFLNNEYKGIYALMEKPKRDSNRVNIEKMTALENFYPDVSGGYIVKIDRPDEPGWYSEIAGYCTGGTKFFYQYVYPNDSVITSQQKAYVESSFDAFENVMNSPTYASTSTGYSKYIDVNSFVDFFIINELSKNVDGYRLSTYLYKQHINQGGKIFIGPVWDYDLAWHNCNYGNTFSSAGWEYQIQDNNYPSPTWWPKLMADSNFVNKVTCRWKELRQNVITTSAFNNYIDSSANVLNESLQRNFTQWQTIGAYVYPNPQNEVGASYSTEITDLKNWIVNRIAWLDANIGGHCAVGIEEQVLVNNLKVFPNPMQTEATFSLKLDKNADISLCITDMMGKEVARFLNANVQQGDSKIVFNRDQIQSGIYLYQIQIDNNIQTGKIIIN